MRWYNDFRSYYHSKGQLNLEHKLNFLAEVWVVGQEGVANQTTSQGAVITETTVKLDGGREHPVQSVVFVGP